MKRAARRCREAGMTLIEVLVAVTLLSLVSVGVLYAMRGGFLTMSKTNQRVDQHRRALGAARAMENLLAHLLPVHADCHGGNPDLIKARILFLQAELGTLRFVSTHSLEESGRGAPRLVELHVIPGDRGEGVRLIVNEYPYTGPLGLGFFCLGPVETPNGFRMGFPPVPVSERSFVLADRLAAARFLYRRPISIPPFEVWEPEWEPTPMAPYPTAIRIELVPLKADASKVLPLTVTVPLRILRDFRSRYAD